MAKDRNLDAVGRRIPDPLPNIIRIETLTEEAQNHYVSVFGKVSNALQFGLRNRVRPNGSNLVFYGFMQNDSLKIDIGATWSNSESSSGGTTARELKKDDGIVTSIVKRGANVISALSSLSNKFLNPSVTQVAGINATATGASTQQSFQGTSLTVPSIECGWYLPQSLQQAVIGLKTLTEMIYPQATTDSQRGASRSLATILNGASKVDLKSSSLDSSDYIKLGAALKKDTANDTELKKILNGLLDGTYSGLQALHDTTEDIMGKTLTFDPMPMRVSLGNRAVLEPVILTTVSIKMSKESFLKTYSDNTKKLLPTFVTVTLGFEYWMTPSPLRNRTSLLGLPMFSEGNKTETRNDRVDIDNDKFDKVFDKG